MLFALNKLTEIIIKAAAGDALIDLIPPQCKYKQKLVNNVSSDPIHWLSVRLSSACHSDSRCERMPQREESTARFIAAIVVATDTVIV